MRLPVGQYAHALAQEVFLGHNCIRCKTQGMKYEGTNLRL